MAERIDPRRAGIERFRARKAGAQAPPDVEPETTEIPQTPVVRTVGLPPPPKTTSPTPAPDGATSPGPAPDEGELSGSEPAGGPPGQPTADPADDTSTDEDRSGAAPPGSSATTTPVSPKVPTAEPASTTEARSPVADPHLERARTVAAGLGARLGVRSTRSDHPEPATYGRRIGNMRGVSTTVSAKTAERLDKLAASKNQTLSRAAMDAVRNHYRSVLADLAPEQDPDDPFGVPPVSVPRENYGVRKEFSVTPQEAETLARLAYDAGISPAALLRTCIERDTDPAASRTS